MAAEIAEIARRDLSQHVEIDNDAGLVGIFARLFAVAQTNAKRRGSINSDSDRSANLSYTCPIGSGKVRFLHALLIRNS